jgi:benzoylformate decarboxylase
MRRAFKIANDAPAGPVFVALPIDVLEQETDIAAAGPGTLYRNAVADPAGVADVVQLLLASRSPVIVAGDDVARADANAALVALAEQIGASVWVEGLRHHVSFPSAHPSARGAVPFDAAAVRKAMGDADLVLLTGGPFFEEVWYAAGDPFPDGAAVVQIEQSPQRLAFNYAPRAGLVGHIGQALAAIRDGVAAGADDSYRAAAAQRNAALKALKDGETTAYRARLEKGGDRLPMSMPRVMAEIHAAVPGNAVIVDESITANLDLAKTFAFNRPGDYYSGRGGGIGQGLAGAIGAKVAHPDRPVVAISGDGSAMYSIQALWSAAHHQLAIVFIILVNREYRVLKHNLDIYRQRFNELTNHPYPHMDLTGPELGFVDLARGMGIAGTAVTKPAEVRAAIEQALASGKPHVIEIAIEGKR